MNLTDIYRVLYPATTQYTFFLAHETLPKIGHKASLNKYKKIDITLGILCDHHGIKLELNNRRNSNKYSNTWRLNNMYLYDQWVIEEIRM
jgi:hypothetical protein